MDVSILWGPNLVVSKVLFFTFVREFWNNVPLHLRVDVKVDKVFPLAIVPTVREEGPGHGVAPEILEKFYKGWFLIKKKLDITMNNKYLPGTSSCFSPVNPQSTPGFEH